MLDDGGMPAPPYELVDNDADLARPHRPRLHRPRRHRLQPCREAGAGQEVLGRRGRHPVGGRVHPPLPDAATSAGPRRCSWSARATAPRARPACPATWSTRASPSTASCSSRRSSTSRPPASRAATTCRTRSSCRPTRPPPGTTSKLPADLQAQAAARVPGRGRALGGRRLPGGPGQGRPARGGRARGGRRTGCRATRASTTTYLEQRDLRIEIQRFCKELLRDAAAHGGPARQPLQGHRPAAAGERPDFDPSMAAIRPPYTATFNDYVRRALGYKSDLHVPHPGRRHRPPWDWGSAGNGFADVERVAAQRVRQEPGT